MFILSDLLRSSLTDGEHKARLADFTVDPTAGDNPQVTGVLWRDWRVEMLPAIRSRSFAGAMTRTPWFVSPIFRPFLKRTTTSDSPVMVGGRN